MRKHLADWIKRYWHVSLIFLCLGIMLGWLFNLSPSPDSQIQPWQFKREFGIADVVGIFNAFVITYLLTTHAQKSISDQREEKNQLMSLVEAVRSSLQICHVFFNDAVIAKSITQPQFHQLTSRNDDLASSLSALASQLRRLEAYSEMDIDSLERTYSKYSNLITGDEISRLNIPVDAKTTENELQRYLSFELQNLKFTINNR